MASREEAMESLVRQLSQKQGDALTQIKHGDKRDVDYWQGKLDATNEAMQMVYDAMDEARKVSN